MDAGKYIKLHLRIVEYIFDRLAVKFTGALFVFIMNFHCLVVGSKARFHYNNKSMEYSFSDLDDESILFFRHNKRALTYRIGLRKRLDLLASEYHLNIIQFSDNDIVLDCGANIGELFLWLKLSGKNITYVGFEPSPLEYQSLQKNTRPSVVHNLGLWNENGEMDFFVASQSADSSFIEPAYFDEVIKVKTVRLESLVDGPVKLLKLEAEGAGPEILEGLGESLKNIEYVSADLGFERGLKSESTLVPVTNYLLKRDFTLLDVSYPRLTAVFKNNRF